MRHLCNVFKDYCSKLGIIVDFDGTLSPLAATPALAFIPHEDKKVLERMSHMVDINIVIISGRDVEDLKQKVSLKGSTLKSEAEKVSNFTYFRLELKV